MTRKASRGKASTRGVFFGIVAAVTIMLLIYFFGGQSVHAITRDEAKEIQSGIDAAQKKIKELDIKIAKARLSIITSENIVSDKKQSLKDEKAKANTSWDAQVNIMTAQTNLDAANVALKVSRDTVIDLLREKSDQIKLVKTLRILDQEPVIMPSKLNHLVKKIGIVNSQICITMNQAGINSTCPTYKEMITLDSSITDISGKFTTDDNGYFHREKPTNPLLYRFYDTDSQLRLFVDPSIDESVRMKIIEIAPNFDTYYDRANMLEYATVNYTDSIGDFTKIEQHQVVYHDRFVDKRCQHAIINANVWEILLPDTIHFMRNNCDDKFTGYITKELILINSTEYNAADSPAYQELQRWDNIAKFCIFKYKAC